MQKSRLIKCIKKLGKIAVLAGLSEYERKISLKSAQAVLSALKRMGFDAALIDIGRGDPLKKIKSSGAGFCFIACHGSPGEDGAVQGMLETMGIPYSGSGVAASAVCISKSLTKTIFKTLNIRTPRGQILRRGAKLPVNYLKRLIPFVAKPASGGSTVGLSIASKASQAGRCIKEAMKYEDEVIVEKYVPGREFTVGYIAGKILPVLEIVPENEYYDYEAKYVPGMSRHIVPAKISAKESSLISGWTGKFCRFAGVRGAARADFVRSKKGVYYALEVNTIPGMTETSLLPEAAAAAGITFNDAVLMIIEDSLGL